MLHAVEMIVRFFAAGQRELDRAPWPKVFLAQANERVHERRGHGFVVDSAAGVQITVLLDQREWIASPVGALRFDGVDVSQQQHGGQRCVATWYASDQIALLGKFFGNDDANVSAAVAGALQARSHPLGGERAIAG
jgi:hypothetical protein